MHGVYELLASYGLSFNACRARLQSWTPDQVMHFLFQICEAMAAEHDRTGARYSFIANGPMGGDRTRCAATACRLARVEETAHFAILYADRVLILDPFERFFGVTDVDDYLVTELCIAVQILHVIRPAVDAGLIGFATGRYCFCEEHYKEHASRARDIQTACDVLEEQFADELDVELRRCSRGDYSWECSVTGPEVLLEHGQQFFLFRRLYDEALEARIVDDNPYVLSPDEVREFGMPNALATPIVNDLLLQNLYATQGFHYLTDREADLDVVAAVNDPATQDNSSALRSGLSHKVPVVLGADLQSLVKLRQNEGEAFRVYRDKLDTVLAELSAESNLSRERAREAFRDEIEPELNRIDQTFSDSRRSIVAKIRQDLVFGAGIVSIGLFSGLFPTDVGQIFAGLGGFKFVTSLLEQANKLCKEPSEIRRNSWYFLWKASRVKPG